MITKIMDSPLLIFVISFLALWCAAWIGARLHSPRRGLTENGRQDFSVILAATLTLLGLIIGFSFSMATTRYDLRKHYEEEEANAIGTEFSRATLLPQADAQQIRTALRQYTNLRVRFYEAITSDDLQSINNQTSQLQDTLWNAVATPAKAQPSPISALAVAGMNDVLNSQGYTQAVWWNRIPIAAWAMMALIAIVSNLLLGYGAHGKHSTLFIILPLVLAISFSLIADIDSPRGGIIRIQPHNLQKLTANLGQP